MSERKKELLTLAILLGVLVLFFSRILFTDKVIRAPDIINEYYWAAINLSKQSLGDIFNFAFKADWDIYNNSGNTLEGGGQGGRFLIWQGLLYYFLPLPASVAWHIVLHLFLGACGTFLCCRAIGASRLASLLGGLIFAIAPENASLINAGHVLKIATISVAPWAFYFLERGFQTRRVIFFLATGFVLAFQFFYTHWQIAYYTCLCIGVYGVARSAGILLSERKNAGKVLLPRLIGLNLVTMFFFLSTVAIDLMPLANWSVETNRGGQSGANQGKGGLEREEAMSWSLPPEEVASFVVPGMFGFSRQEAGENPAGIGAYYWGRMVFTQTTDYIGLLPWLLLPLSLIFRRDRYTWLALAAVAGGIIFSMGKYSFIYQFLFDHFPGINRFRVPKMMMFMVVLGLSVLAARGVDCLIDDAVRKTEAFRRYLWGLLVLPALLLVLLGTEFGFAPQWLEMLADTISQPTRYEQGVQLISQRWNNLVVETGIAVLVSALYGVSLYLLARKHASLAVAGAVLTLLYVGDVWRVNDKFMSLVEVPKESRDFTSPVIDYLAKESKEYRVLPMNSGPGPYSAKKIPVMFVPMPVQQRRWQEYLDAFSFTSAMPDLLNIKYLVIGKEQYEKEKAQLGDKYVPVFQSPDGAEIVLLNRSVLPKAWLVPAVGVIDDSGKALAILQNPQFDPRRLAVVESPPPVPMADPNAPLSGNSGDVALTRYEGEHITAQAKTSQSSLLVLGEKFYKGWRATVDGKPTVIYPVNHILRGVYLSPGEHTVEFVFDPLPFKVGKWLTLASFAFFAAMLVREWLLRRMRSEE